MNWFDLSELDAKLERVRKGPGLYVLQISLGADDPRLSDLTAERLETHGWLPEVGEAGDVKFINHRVILKAADVAQSLTVFFDEQQIRDAYKPLDTMSQGEVVEGLKTRDMASVADFEAEMVGVSPKDASRIISAIGSAADKFAKIQRAGVSHLFDGRGTELLAKLADEVGAATAAAALLSVTQSHRNITLEVALENVLNAPSPIPESIRDRVTALVPKPLVEHISSEIETWRSADGIMSDGKGTQLDAALGQLRGKVPILVLEPVKDSPLSTDELEAGLGMVVRRDKSLPTSVYRHTLTSLNEALDAVADAIQQDRSRIVPEQGSVVLRVARKFAMADERFLGVRRTAEVDTEGDDVQSVSAIAVSAIYGGSFVHEIGHLVESGYGITDDERREILDAVGVRGRVFRAVRQDLESERIDDDFAAYLRSDSEIFARTFEAAIINRALQEGDETLSSVGGLTSGFRGDHYSPIGDNQLTEKFLSEVSKLIDRKLSLEHAKKADTDVERLVTAEP